MLLDDLAAKRERNAQDAAEIDRLSQIAELRARECADLVSRIKILEGDLQKAHLRGDDLNRALEHRTQELKGREAALRDAECELSRLKSQQAIMEHDLEHLRQTEARLRSENQELERRFEGETRKNNELTTGVTDLETQIRRLEDAIHLLRQEAENLRQQLAHLSDLNSQLQAEIDALGNHIRVLQRQNQDLSNELDDFVNANEAIRTRLDRRNRVEGLRSKNEAQLQSSLKTIQDAKSPLRGYPYPYQQ